MKDLQGKNPNNQCPYLGLKKDKDSILAYPSIGNTCYHSKGNPIPNLDHQRSFCLTSNHVDCQIYEGVPGNSMPINIQQQQSKISITSGAIIKASIILVFAVVLIFVIFNHSLLFSQFEQLLMPAWQQTQKAQSLNPSSTPTLEILSTETPLPTTTLLPTKTPIPTLTETFIPTATPTAQPIYSPTVTQEPAVLALETPIGSELKFIIVRIKEGEALAQFARRYGTTDAAIRAINYNLPSVLYVDRILVIPVDITDVNGLPAFEALEIREGGQTIEELAQKLGVAVEDLYFYNDILPGRIMEIGEWLLVPRD